MSMTYQLWTILPTQSTLDFWYSDLHATITNPYTSTTVPRVMPLLKLHNGCSCDFWSQGGWYMTLFWLLCSHSCVFPYISCITSITEPGHPVSHMSTDQTKVFLAFKCYIMYLCSGFSNRAWVLLPNSQNFSPGCWKGQGRRECWGEISEFFFNWKKLASNMIMNV